MSEAIFIIVLHVSAFGYSASVVPDQPRLRTAYASESDCKKDIPSVRRVINIPAIATLNSIECRKLEFKK